MLTITENQIRERWDVLPENLREAVYSETSVDIVADACAANHLSEERTRSVHAVVSAVLMGFLRSDIDDVSREIRERAQIHPDIAYGIAKEIDKRIFLPLRNDLERVYAPPRKERIPLKSIFEPIPVASPSAPPEEIKTPVDMTEKNAEPPLSPELPAERIFSPLQREIEIRKTAPKSQEIPATENESRREEPAPETPFILHREKDLFEPSAPPERPSVSVTTPPAPPKPSSAPRKITVRIETPDGEEKGQARVVHYSAFRTPLDKDGRSTLV